MAVKKLLWVALGWIGIGLGAIGAVLPMLPAFPFLLVAAISFGKSSERLERWFKGTKLYKNNLETYIKGQGMSRKVKVRVMVVVTLLMSVGFFLMAGRSVYAGCAVLGVVWIAHVLYFWFGVKTMEKEG